MLKIRKAKLADALGMAQVVKEGLKNKNWLYTGSNKYDLNKFKKLQASLSSRSATEIYFVAADKNIILGSCSYCYKKIGRLRHRIDLGWGLRPDCQGQGIGTELLKSTLEDATKRGFKRAEAEIVIKNVASWKMALRCGFNIEGTKKKALLTDDGKYIDTYIVGKIL